MSIKKLKEKYSDIKETKLETMSIVRMFNVLKDENDVYWMNIFKNFEINENTLNDPTKIKSQGIRVPWWEMLSFSYYNNVDAWWFMCQTNNVLNPFEEIIIGGTIDMLPSYYLSHVERDMEVIFNL